MQQSVEAEQGVIGSVMQSEEAYDEVSEIIIAEDYAVCDHKLIYQAITNLKNEGKGVDLITVNNELIGLDASNERSFESSDDSLGYIAALIDAVPSVSQAATYARLVKEYSVSRQLKAAGAEIIAVSESKLKTEQKIAEASEAIEGVLYQTKTDSNKSIRGVLLDTITEIERLSEMDGGLSGLSTGFSELDEMTSGLQDGELFIIAARPSQGKSTIALNIAQHVAKFHPVQFFSLEMSSSALGLRMISSEGDIPLKLLRAGEIKEPQLNDKLNRATRTIASDVKLFIDDTSTLSIDILRRRARIAKRKHDIKLIVVDYLQFLTGKGENKTTETGYISRGLKSLAKDLQLPVIALSQLNRGLSSRNDKRPTMSDLRGSGDIEQDADVIAFLHNEESYDKNTHLKDLAELIIAKQRQGETGTIWLRPKLHLSRFVTNYDPIPQPVEHNNPKKPAFNNIDHSYFN